MDLLLDPATKLSDIKLLKVFSSPLQNNCCPKRNANPAGTGTVVNKTGIKQYQQATRDRSKSKTEGGKIIRVEAHPIPEHPRPRRVKGRATLVGDAAGYVTKCSGEGIYFAAKSGRMCAEAIVEASAQGMSTLSVQAVVRKCLLPARPNFTAWKASCMCPVATCSKRIVLDITASNFAVRL